MSGQIIFLRKNHMDADRPNPIITITDSVATSTGQTSVFQLRNRNNISGWLTTGSDDTANTEILVEFGDLLNIDFIELVRNNFKDYLVEWKDVSDAWNTYVSVTANTERTNVHALIAPVNARAIRITINSTQIVDADKELRQLIITEKIHVFEGWPVIKNPTFSRGRKINKVLSGKVNVATTRGAFSCELSIRISSSENDMEIHKNLYDRQEGVLMLLSGGDESQFKSATKNYANEDIVLVTPVDEYKNPWEKGIYSTGIKISMKLAEATH